MVLQVLCIFLIVQYSQYHQAAFGGTANQFTGKINAQYDKVEYYFQLKRTNDSLLRANEALYNMLAANYNLPDTNIRQRLDTMRMDSIIQYRKFTYLSAKVVSNSLTSQSNFIVMQSAHVAKCV